MLRRSGKPEERQLGEVLAAVADLGGGIAGLAKRLAEPATFLPPAYIRELLVRELRPLFFELKQSTLERPWMSDTALIDLAFSLNEVRQSIETEEPDKFERDKIKGALALVIKRLGVVLQSMKGDHLDNDDRDNP